MSEEATREIQGIGFREGGVIEIQYVEPYDMSENAAIIRSLVFDANITEGVSQSVAELVSDMQDIIDAVVDALRDPPAAKPGRW